jgi:hypothetical protein
MLKGRQTNLGLVPFDLSNHRTLRRSFTATKSISFNTGTHVQGCSCGRNKTKSQYDPDDALALWRFGPDGFGVWWGGHGTLLVKRKTGARETPQRRLVWASIKIIIDRLFVRERPGCLCNCVTTCALSETDNISPLFFFLHNTPHYIT